VAELTLELHSAAGFSRLGLLAESALFYVALATVERPTWSPTHSSVAAGFTPA